MADHLTADSWQNRRVVVTGANGFLGSHLVHRLLELGVRVSVLVRRQSSTLRLSDIMERLDVAYGDLVEAQEVEACIGRSQPEVVFHLAAAGVFPGPDAATVMRANVMGTTNLLEALKRHAVKRLVNVGSVSEYGSGQHINEDHPLQPTNVYGVSKAAADLLAQAYGRSSPLSVVTVRPFTPFGPMEHPQRLIPGTIFSALRGEDLPMTGGEQERDFTYVSDVVEGILAAALYQGENVVFNLCSGTGRSIKDVATQIVNLMGDPIRLRIGALPYREGEMWYQSGDNARACRELGWEPRVSFEDGLRRTIAWCREQAEVAAPLNMQKG